MKRSDGYLLAVSSLTHEPRLRMATMSQEKSAR